MAYRVNIEASVWSDPRFDVLANLLGVDRFSAVGRMASLWATCTERETDKLTSSMCSAVLGCSPDRVAEVFRECELANETKDGLLRLRGCKGRTDWLKKKRKAGRKGGVKSAKQRQAAASISSKQTASKSNPPAPAPAPAPAKEQGAVEDKPRPSPKKKPPPPGLKEATDAFHRLYLEATGSKPTWGAKQVAMVKRLVTQHGSDEVAKRAHVLFTSPPSWLSPPYDIGTLVQHFDKLVDAKPQNRRRERRWDAEGNEVLT